MLVSRWLMVTIGSLLAILAGGWYFWFSFISAWDSNGAPSAVAKWVGISAAITLFATALPTVALRPLRPWLYPLMFALPVLSFGIFALVTDPVRPLLFITIGVLTLGVGICGAYLTRHVISRLARSNNRIERTREP